MSSRSIEEESLSALWLIAGLLAHQLGWYVFAWILFGKAAGDAAISITAAIRCRKKD